MTEVAERAGGSGAAPGKLSPLFQEWGAGGRPGRRACRDPVTVWGADALPPRSTGRPPPSRVVREMQAKHVVGEYPPPGAPAAPQAGEDGERLGEPNREQARGKTVGPCARNSAASYPHGPAITLPGDHPARHFFTGVQGQHTEVYGSLVPHAPSGEQPSCPPQAVGTEAVLRPDRGALRPGRNEASTVKRRGGT